MSALILKRASASRPSGEWRDDDYDVVEDGVIVGRIFKVSVRAGGPTVDVGERPQRRHTPSSARLRADARGGYGGVREEPAVGVTMAKATTKLNAQTE
jgi:hypothetical protein